MGVVLDEKLNFTAHIKHARKKAYTTISLLHKLICQRSSLSYKNKLLIYKMLVKPIILYAAPVWTNTCKTNIEHLEIIQRKVLRMIQGRGLSDIKDGEGTSNDIPSLMENIKRLTKNFFIQQLYDINILKDLGKMDHNSAPFKIRHKLPHQLLMGGG